MMVFAAGTCFVALISLLKIFAILMTQKMVIWMDWQVKVNFLLSVISWLWSLGRSSGDCHLTHPLWCNMLSFQLNWLFLRVTDSQSLPKEDHKRNRTIQLNCNDTLWLTFNVFLSHYWPFSDGFICVMIWSTLHNKLTLKCLSSIHVATSVKIVVECLKYT